MAYDNMDTEASLFANKKLFKKNKVLNFFWKMTAKHFSAASNMKMLNKGGSARIRNSSLDVLISEWKQSELRYIMMWKPLSFEYFTCQGLFHYSDDDILLYRFKMVCVALL